MDNVPLSCVKRMRAADIGRYHFFHRTPNTWDGLVAKEKGSHSDGRFRPAIVGYHEVCRQVYVVQLARVGKLPPAVQMMLLVQRLDTRYWDVQPTE